MSVIEIINQIEANKKERHIWPFNAIILEIEDIAATIHPFMHRQIVKAELEELVYQGKILIAKTINDYYITVL